MRILRIADISDNRTGGMSRTMYCTGDELQRMGHEVEYWFENRIRSRTVPIQFRRFIIPWRIVLELERELLRGKAYDIVEIHEPISARYAWQRQRLPPLVIFSYGLEERSHEAMLGYRRLKGLPVSTKMRFSPLSVVWQAAYSVRRAAHVICSNSEDVNHLRNAGVPDARLTRHHSGVEANFLKAGSQISAAGDRPGILFLGAWLLRKGILDVVAAVVRLFDENPTAVLTIAGCVVESGRVLADFPLGVRHRIRVIPNLASNEELIALYREHGIFLLPSYFEGQPLAMIEAAAMGMAIVTTAVCGMKDFIEDGVNGFAVKVGDSDAIYHRLQTLLNDPSLRSRLGSLARQQAQKHTWSAATAKIEAAYCKVATLS